MPNRPAGIAWKWLSCAIEALVLLFASDGLSHAFATAFSGFPEGEKVTSGGLLTTRLDGPDSLKVEGLVRAPDGTFYGTTRDGGLENKGSLFKISAAGEFTILASFNDTTGSLPRGIALDSQGVIRGIAATGGAYSGGTIFKYSAAGGLIAIHAFPPDAITTPDLLLNSDGNFYGTTRGGGANNVGAVYCLTPADEFAIIYSFPAIGARLPVNGLVEIPGGDMLGIVESGLFGQAQAYRVTRAGAVGLLGSLSSVGGFPFFAPPLVRGADGEYYGTTSFLFSVSLDGSVHRRAPIDGAAKGSVVAASDGRIYLAAANGNVYRYAPLTVSVKRVLEFPDRSVAFPSTGFEENGALVGIAGASIFRFPLHLQVVTEAALSVNATSEKLSGTVLTEDVTSVYFEYGPTVSYGDVTPSQVLTVSALDQPFEATIDGLSTGALYHFRAVAASDGTTHYGTDRTFTPTYSQPSVVTFGATELTSASAVLNGFAVTGANAAIVYFEYGGSATPPQTIPADSRQQFQATVSALPENTTFYVRAVLTTNGVTVFGATTGFTTRADPPAAVTEQPELVGRRGALLKGMAVSPRQTAMVQFEYGTTPAAELSTPAQVIQPSSTAQSFAALISELQNDGTYYVRAVVTIGSKVSRGSTIAFKVVNNPPIAVDDVVSFFPGDTVIIDVLQNDRDPDGDTLSIESFTSDGVGVVTQEGQLLQYASSPFDTERRHSFTYSIRDTFGAMSNATVNLENHISELAGLHAPVLTDAGGALVGQLRLALSRTKQFSGTLTVNGVSWILRGSFPSDGLLSQTLKEAGKPDLQLQLDLDTLSEEGKLGGAVTIDGATFLLVPAAMIPFQDMAHVLSQSTMLLAPTLGQQPPIGTGWAIVKIAANGSVRIVGTLADGTRISIGERLPVTRRLSVLAPLYRHGAGELAGNLDFQLGRVSGSLRWKKPAQTTDTVYPQGFNLSLDAAGFPYIPPQRKSRILTYSNASAAEATLRLVFESSAPPAMFRLAVRKDEAITVLEGTGDLRVELHRGSGKISGSLKAPHGARALFSGVVLQELNYGAGFFIGPSGNGSIEFFPQ